MWKRAVRDQGWHCARYGSVNVSQKHYTLTQPETLGLIDNTLLNKKQMLCMYTVFSMQYSMANRRGGRLLCWPRLELNKQYNARTSTDITTVMHVAVNMIGARHWCGVVLIMGHRHQWRHRLGVSWRRTPFILNDDRLLYPALFFKSITLRVWALSSSNLYNYFQHWISFLVIIITCPYDHNWKS